MKAFPLFTAILTLPALAESYKIAPTEAITARVNDAETRLAKTEGGQLLWESIEAHGGLHQWFANGLLEFRWTYNMDDMGAQIDTTQVIDTWSSRARHTGHGVVEGVTFGWDGTQGWTSPEDAKTPFPPSFWALTPYYFVGVPHVLADPGTVHEKLPDQIAYEGTMYDQVKVTYTPDTGETPDDYCIALIHPKTKQIKGVRYIVTDLRITKGKKATAEKLLTYEGWHDLSGVLFPKSHLSYSMNGNTVGDKIRSAMVSDAKFLGEAEISFSTK